MKFRFLFAALFATAMVAHAEQDEQSVGTDATEPAGFVTEMLNEALQSKSAPSADSEKVEYGRKVTKYVSAPKFGGYFIGSYKYTDQEGQHKGDGFNVRLVRMYVDGTVLNDFTYRFQVEYNKSVHLKDVFVEWNHFKEFRVKLGQYKRIFTFEDPYNPWEVGTGDYSQVTKKLSGFSDYTAKEYNGSNGGRDIGLQFQGDLFPIGKDKRRFVHYQVGVFNGQGINVADANGKKDWMGTVQIQPVKDLYIGVFGWKGSYTADKVTAEKNRWAVGAKYEHNGWSARAEYAHHTGHKISDYNKEKGTWSGNGRADGWYATVGVPCTDWLKVYAKYDAYRETASYNTLRAIYSICPNFQLHKNLQLQLQYNMVHDRSIHDKYSNEVWAQTYIRF